MIHTSLRSRPLAAVILLAFVSTVHASSIVSISSSIPGYPRLGPTGVSADGSVVVGTAADNVFDHGRAFRWTSAGGTVDLGTLGGTDSIGTELSASGNVVTGTSFTSSGMERAFRWTSVGGMVSLGTLGGTQSEGHDTDADGSVVVGSSTVAGDQTNHAFRWTSAGGLADIHTSTAAGSAATGVNGDGSVVVGVVAAGEVNEHVFRWTAGGGMVDLGAFRDTAQPEGVSADGRVIVGSGYTRSTDVMRAFRWTAETGFVDLGTLGGNSYAGAVSSDGLLTAGYSAAGAFLWDAAHGMRDLKLTLAGLGVNMTGWSLSSVQDIGYDGTNYYLVGEGTRNGTGVAFLATLDAAAVPEPSISLSLLIGLGTLGLKGRRHRASSQLSLQTNAAA